MNRRGPFICLDGIDGTGKSTQCQLLVSWLQSQNIPVTRCADPGGTPVGDQLRAILLDPASELSPRTETLLFMASRAELMHRIIRPALEVGHVVLSDRFVSANVVYQGYAGGLKVPDLWQVGRFSADNILPDLTIILDLPIQQAASRRGRTADRLEARGEAYFERVRAGFLAIAHDQPGSYHIVDANSSIEEIQRQLRELITPVLLHFGHRLSEHL